MITLKDGYTADRAMFLHDKVVLVQDKGHNRELTARQYGEQWQSGVINPTHINCSPSLPDFEEE